MENLLEKEFQTFTENQLKLAQDHLGKFVLIKGSDIIDVFEDQIEAIEKGIEKFGKEPFLVNEITSAGFRINYLPRLVKV